MKDIIYIDEIRDTPNAKFVLAEENKHFLTKVWDCLTIELKKKYLELLEYERRNEE